MKTLESLLLYVSHQKGIRMKTLESLLLYEIERWWRTVAEASDRAAKELQLFAIENARDVVSEALGSVEARSELALLKNERDAAYELGKRDSERLPAWARPAMIAAFDYQAALTGSCATHAERRLYDALDIIASTPEHYAQCIGK